MARSNRKEEIFKTAVALMRIHGYRNTSMRDIAGALKIEAPSLYNHISSKEDLLWQTCTRIAGAFEKGIAEVNDIYFNPQEKLGMAIRSHIVVLTQDLDLEMGLLYVRRGKGGRWRAVPMSERIRKELSEYLATRQNVGHKGFLLSKKGRALSGSNANRRLKILLEKAGLPTDISLHSLRHSIASHLLQSGLSMEEVRRFLGHNHLETTQIYLHNGLEDLA